MSIKASKACVEKLISEGIKIGDITVKEPVVVLTSNHLQRVRMDCSCQVGKRIYLIQIQKTGLKTA